MCFNRFILTASIVVASSITAACGSAKNTRPTNVETRQAIGSTPEFYSSAFSAASVDSNFVIATNEQSMTLNEYSLQPFANTKSIQLPFNTLSQQVISDDQRKWFIVVSGADYAIMKSDGSSVKNPVEVQGQIAGIAVDPITDSIVITDTFGSMAMLQLSAEGDVVASWITGPLLRQYSTIASATFLSGKLIAPLAPAASSKDTTIVVADVPASIKANQWVLRELKIPDPTFFSWVASAPATEAHPNAILARSENKLILIDVDTGEVFDTLNFGERKFIGNWREKEPHVATTSVNGPIDSKQLQTLGIPSTLIDIHYVGLTNKIETKTIATSAGTVQRSWFEPKFDRITALASNGRTGSHAVRYRLSDNLLLAAVALPTYDTQIALTPDFIYVQYTSTLGYAERWGYGRTQAKESIKNYNLKAIMAQQKNK